MIQIQSPRNGYFAKMPENIGKARPPKVEFYNKSSELDLSE